MISTPSKKVRRHQYHGPQTCHKIVTPTKVQKKRGSGYIEARGHLFHKTGTPPKHFNRECIKAF